MTEPQNSGAAGESDQPAGDLLEGAAVGGPLDGGTMTSRRPAGVILVDRPANQAWRYAWLAGAFTCLDAAAPMVLVRDPGAEDNLERAADEGLWDVQAAPWVGGDPNEVDPDAALADVVVDDQGDDDEPAQLGREVTGPIDESGV